MWSLSSKYSGTLFSCQPASWIFSRITSKCRQWPMKKKNVTKLVTVNFLFAADHRGHCYTAPLGCKTSGAAGIM